MGQVVGFVTPAFSKATRGETNPQSGRKGVCQIVRFGPSSLAAGPQTERMTKCFSLKMIVILISITAVVIKFVRHRANVLGTICVYVLETRIWRFRLKVTGPLNSRAGPDPHPDSLSAHGRQAAPAGRRLRSRLHMWSPSFLTYKMS